MRWAFEVLRAACIIAVALLIVLASGLGLADIAQWLTLAMG